MLLFSIQLQKYKQVANKHYKVVHMTHALNAVNFLSTFYYINHILY